MITHPVLHDLARFGVRLGLRRMRSFLEFVGDPAAAFPVIHVAGTNGKGSVVRALGAVLRAAGYRTGEYISPHLQRVNERIRVDNQEIADADLDALLRELDDARRRWARQEDAGGLPEDQALTYFEMMTAAGMLHMARQRVDVAVVEVGLGGRLDATNVVDPLVSVIVTIGLDHVEQLGPDLASIAAEKAGIIKPGRPAVAGPLPPDAARVVRLICQERGSPLLEYGEHFRTLPSENGRFTWTCGDVVLRDLELALPGAHQVENAGVALATLHAIRDRLPAPESAIRQGLAGVRHAGRLEWLAPDLLIDSAHNPDGAASLAAYLRALPRDRPRTLLLGASNDKDIRSIAVQLVPHVDRVLTTHCDHPRAASAGDIAGQLVGVDAPILPAGPVEQALPLARDGRTLVIVAGSIFLAGAARDIATGGG